MTAPAGLDDAVGDLLARLATNPGPCQCVTRHRPPAVVVEVHHVEPRSWGGDDVASNRLRLCPTTHYTVHRILNGYALAAGPPPAAWLRQFPRYARTVAAQGWARHLDLHPNHPTPFGP